MAARFCASCGSPVNPGWTFCQSCGSPLQASSPPPRGPYPTSGFGPPTPPPAAPTPGPVYPPSAPPPYAPPPGPVPASYPSTSPYVTPSGTGMGPGISPPPGSAPHRHTGVIIVVAIVVVLVLILVLYLGFHSSSPGPPATVTWSGLAVTCYGCTVGTWISPGTQWVIDSGTYEWDEWGCLNIGCSEVLTITGTFSSTSAVTLYLFTPSEYYDYHVNGTVASYIYTTGSVVVGSISTNVAGGDYYIVVQN